MREITYAEAIREAVFEEMEKDEKVFLLGEDIEIGNIFRLFKGFLEKFGPERVRNTPISENAIVGAALGAAIMGMRPVAEIMFMDFLNCAGDQLVNHVPKIDFMSGRKLRAPMVIRTQYSLGTAHGAQHSQFFPTFYMNIPGLCVATPSTPYDAKGLLKTAIRGDKPVLFIECNKLYWTKGSVPEEEYLVSLGKGDVKKEGDDVTIFAFSRTVPIALAAAERLAKEGISVEVVDPRTLVPLDKQLLFNSVKKTGRLVTVEDSCKTGGVGAEVSSLVAEEVMDYLDSPIVRVASLDTPVPFSPPLEEIYVPNEEKVIEAVRRVTA